MADFSSCSLEELIEVMTSWPVGMPVRAMERVLAAGEAAIPVLSAALHRWQTDDGRDLLWPVVLLGELRNPSAIEPLVEQIRRTEEEELGLAAAESLVKIGAASLPALRQLAGETDPIVRIYGYAALGWLCNDEAFSILLDALHRVPELADVLAQALCDQGRKEAIPAVYDAYQKCPPWQRIEFEDALRDLHFGQAEPLLWTKNWKTRYRREPFWGRFEFGWAGIAVMVRHDVEALTQRVSPPLKSLEEILREHAQPQDSAERCEDCGGLVERPTGLPVCPETALRTALYQVKFLGEARNDGVEEISDLFDHLDEMLFEHYEEEEFLREREQKRWREQSEDLEMQQETCRWLVEQGIENIGGARASLLAKAAWLAERYGDPEGLLSPPRRIEKPAPKVGRNDPCPCGSGRKYKRCCLDNVAKVGTD
jgi:hypothetical protein